MTAVSPDAKYQDMAFLQLSALMSSFCSSVIVSAFSFVVIISTQTIKGPDK
jgi:hypothetical protein